MGVSQPFFPGRTAGYLDRVSARRLVLAIVVFGLSIAGAVALSGYDAATYYPAQPATFWTGAAGAYTTSQPSWVLPVSVLIGFLGQRVGVDGLWV